MCIGGRERALPPPAPPWASHAFADRRSNRILRSSDEASVGPVGCFYFNAAFQATPPPGWLCGVRVGSQVHIAGKLGALAACAC